MRTQTRKPTHPGIVFYSDVLEPLGLSIKAAAEKLNVSRKHLSDLCHGKARLSPEIATKIAAATDTSAESWLIMQTKLDVWEINQAGKPDVEPFQMQVA